jgi:hypothetical protein
MFPQSSNSEDWFITTQILHYAGKISYVPVVLYHYCYNPKSITRNDPGVKKINEAYINYTLIINFLKEQYNDLPVFDPELSNFVNRIKLWIILNRRTRREFYYRLFELYPDSNKLIFNQKSRSPIYHKIFLFMATRNILFPLKLMDIYYILRKKFKNARDEN